MAELHSFLKLYLQPFIKYFKMKGVSEICINQPGEVWVDTDQGWLSGNRKGGPLGPHKDNEMTLELLTGFAKHLAQSQGQIFDDAHPLLSTSIPEYGFRVQVVGGSSVSSGICISIRVAAAQRFPVESYLSAGDAKAVIDMIHNEKTFLICGGTHSGKTTLLNSLLRHIPMDTRIGVIEDTAELIIDQPNHFRFLKSKSGTDIGKVGYGPLIDACLRMRPDRLILGELDIHNTIPFLKVSNTGHGGSMASLHANSPKEAIDALVINASLAGFDSPDATRRFAEMAIDFVIFIKKGFTNGKRSYEATVEHIQDIKK